MLSCRFERLTTPEGITSWWSTSAEFDARMGGEYHLHFAGPDVDVRGEVVELDPPHRLAYTWSWDHEDSPVSTVSFALSEEVAGTRLRLHRETCDALYTRLGIRRIGGPDPSVVAHESLLDPVATPVGGPNRSS